MRRDFHMYKLKNFPSIEVGFKFEFWVLFMSDKHCCASNITDAFNSRDSSNSGNARHFPDHKEDDGCEVGRHRLGAQQQRGILNSKIASTEAVFLNLLRSPGIDSQADNPIYRTGPPATCNTAKCNCKDACNSRDASMLLQQQVCQ